MIVSTMHIPEKISVLDHFTPGVDFSLSLLHFIRGRKKYGAKIIMWKL